MNRRRKQKLAGELWDLLTEKKSCGKTRFVVDNKLGSQDLHQIVTEMLRDNQPTGKKRVPLPNFHEEIQWLCETADFVQTIANTEEIGRIGSIRIYDLASVREEKIIKPKTPFAENYEALYWKVRHNTEDIFLDSDLGNIFNPPDKIVSDRKLIRKVSPTIFTRLVKESLFRYIFLIYSGRDYDQAYMYLLDISNLEDKCSLDSSGSDSNQLRKLRLRHHPNTIDLVASELLSWWEDGMLFVHTRMNQMSS